LIASFELSHQNQQTRKPMFVDGRFQQFLDLVQSQTVILLSDGTLRRHPDANELVTFSVFAFAHFEPSQISGTVSLCGLREFALQGGETRTGFHGLLPRIRQIISWHHFFDRLVRVQSTNLGVVGRSFPKLVANKGSPGGQAIG
jgi:hypothetical protein